MNKINNNSSSCDQDENHSQLDDMLTYYKKLLSEMHSEVNQGQDFLKMGMKTAIVQDFENVLLNPLKAMLDTKQVVDNKVIEVIDGFVSFFIAQSKQKNIIDSAFKKMGPSNALYYGITLNEDNFENRNKVLGFLSFYNTFDFCDKVPVYFQFVPAHLVGNFKKVTKIA